MPRQEIIKSSRNHNKAPLWKRAVAIGMFAVSSLGLFPGNAIAQDSEVQRDQIVTVERLAGNNRHETAVEISQDSFPEDHSAGAVVIVNGHTHADAQVAAGLAAAHNAPMLTTTIDSMPEVSLDEAVRVAAPTASGNYEGYAFVIGGEAVVSQDVVEQLEDQGFFINRLAGGNRFETSAIVADYMEEKGIEDYRFVVDGTDSRYATTAASLSAQFNMRENNEVVTRPDGTQYSEAGGYGSVIYTNGDEMPQVSLDVLNDRSHVTATYAVGAAALEATAGLGYVQGIVDETGSSPILTALQAVEVLYGDSNEAFMPNVAFVNVNAWADGLAAAPNALDNSAITLLTEQDQLAPSVVEYLQNSDHTGAFIYGGEAVISGYVQEQVEAALSRD